MRIAIASDIYLPQLSGVGDSIASLAASLTGAGHDVRIYAPRVTAAAPEPHVRRLAAIAIPRSGGNLLFVLPLGGARDLRRFKPDVIHVHTFSTVGLMAARVADRHRIPLVGTDHTFPADYLHYLKLDFPPLPDMAMRFAARFYDRCKVVTAPSQAMIDQLREHGMKAPAMVLSNPIRTDLFHPLPRRETLKRKLGIGPEAVLLFGRLAAEKNLDGAVDVFATVAERRHAQLVVIGKGPYGPQLERILRERGLIDRSLLLGELRGEALNEAINACDVFLTTSTSETQSMTMLQASAAGLPVVAIRAGGLPEYVRDAQTGFIVDPGDRERFASLIVSLLDDRVFARGLGTKGRQFALTFAPESIAARFAEAYAEAIAADRADAPLRQTAG